MDNNLCSSLITWLRTFPGHDNLTVSSLTDGVAMGAILHQIAPEYFTDQWLAKIRTDVADNWRLKVSNLKKIYQGVMDYFYISDLSGQIQQFPTADLNKIVEQNDELQLGRVLQLILGCAINCEQKQKHIEAIMGMEERTQALIVNAIQDLMNRESSPGSPDAMGPNPSSGAWLGPSSFHLQMKTLVEQLESTSLAKDDMAKRCNELDLQITILKEDKKKFAEENEKLLERLEVFESGGDIGAQRFRYKDLKKQVDTLKDELYKVESSRDEYRSRVEGLETETKELATRNEELQHLAEEARSLKDEVDALRDMSERVAVYEGTVETYKKKLEELSDLKRQVKILEEKNSEYMQQNMELEEEVKKSGTWRPQLDLYKKQVSELHQKLAEEAKKTDRQIFENKKLFERLEALTQEKERLALERDVLKENVEELNCTVSALSSPDTGSRPPSDQSDIETLEIIPPEIREKIARLQHENRLLKQKTSDKSNESAPVLQSLLNDLQERHDKLLQENRWEKFSPPSPPSYHHPQWPPLGRMWPLDAYFMLDSPTKYPNKKLKVIKRNLKWASESDLLVLRQPSLSNLVANILSAKGNKLRNGSGREKSRTLPSNALAPVSPNPPSKDPIVIHHIHEFKVAPSPTNDDSGCCRTSPSSCEGCEDHRSSGSYGIRTPDYGNTLDSGVSGMFRCLSPVIPSIVEECTTHHISDILPALLDQGGNPAVPSVMHHTHPSHLNTNHAHSGCFCCSPPSKSPCGILTEVAPTKTPPLHPYSSSTSPNLPPDPVPTQHVKGNNGELTVTSIIVDQQQQQLPVNEYYSQNSPSQESTVPGPNRKQSSNLPKKPEPPDSPTPHNSPRLPHSINSYRSKSSKLPVSQIPANNNSSIRGSSVRSIRKPSITEDKKFVQKGEERNVGSCNISKPVTSKEVKKFTDSYSQTIQKHFDCEEKSNSRSARSKPYLETDLDRVFTHRFRAGYKETSLDRLTGRLKSGILNKVRSKSLDKQSKSRPQAKLSVFSEAVPLNNETPINAESNPSTDVLNQEKLKPKRLSENKSDDRIEKMRYVRRGSISSSVKSRSSTPSKENNRKSWGFENSDLFRSLKENTFMCLQPQTSERKKEIEEVPLTPAKTTLRSNSVSSVPENVFVARNDKSGLPLPNLRKSESESHIKMRRKLRPFSSKSNQSNITSSSSDLGNRRSASSMDSASSLNNFQTPRGRKGDKKSAGSSDVTLITDTLFTHFVVSPKNNEIQRKSQKKNFSSTPSISSAHSLPVPSVAVFAPSRKTKSKTRLTKRAEPFATDTDTDLELIENKLVSSAFGAPIVSSESFTSFVQSDMNTDMDPSATDYCTDHESDFNPSQYKLLTLENQQRPLQGFVPNNRTAKKNAPDTEALIPPATQPAIYSNNYLKRKRQQMILASKNKLLNGGIVKVKNKTAKAVVAETFNAMFTFCTP